MNVILLTVFIGLVLVFLFVTLFLQHFSKSGSFSPDRESLLPLDSDAGFQEVQTGLTAKGAVVMPLASTDLLKAEIYSIRKTGSLE